MTIAEVKQKLIAGGMIDADDRAAFAVLNFANAHGLSVEKVVSDVINEYRAKQLNYLLFTYCAECGGLDGFCDCNGFVS